MNEKLDDVGESVKDQPEAQGPSRDTLGALVEGSGAARPVTGVFTRDLPAGEQAVAAGGPSAAIPKGATAYLAAAQGSIWAADPFRMSGYLNTPVVSDVQLADVAALSIRPSSKSGSVAVLPLHGPIVHRPSLFSALFGGTATELWLQSLSDLVADESVGAIVIDVDSPGGTVDGVPETAAEIYKARKKKPVIAVANSLAASAAYWIASAASEVYATPSAVVGSIGVWSLHEDFSKRLEELGVKPTFIFFGEHKVELNPYEPLSEEAKEYEQGEVDRYGGLFVGDVAKYRGTTAATVKRDWGQGRLLGPEVAKGLGVVDGIATLQQVVKKLGGKLAERREIAEAAERRRAEIEGLGAEFGQPEAEGGGKAPGLKLRSEGQHRMTDEMLGDVAGFALESEED